MNEELQTTEEGVVQSDAPVIESQEAQTVESETTDEQKNEQALAEAAEQKRVREERRQNGVQKRIDELTREKYEQKARADTLEQLLKTQTHKPTEATEPKREDFESYEDFLEARTEYRADKIVQERLSKYEQTQKQTQNQNQQEQSHREAERQFAERARALEKDYPDYKEVVEESDVEIPNSVLEMMQRLKEGPLLAYHIASNPSLADQFRGQSRDVQGVLLGQMIATLKAPPKVSSAPPPGKTVSTAKHGSTNEPPTNPDLYRAWADKNLR